MDNQKINEYASLFMELYSQEQFNYSFKGSEATINSKIELEQILSERNHDLCENEFIEIAFKIIGTARNIILMNVIEDDIGIKPYAEEFINLTPNLKEDVIKAVSINKNYCEINYEILTKRNGENAKILSYGVLLNIVSEKKQAKGINEKQFAFEATKKDILEIIDTLNKIVSDIEDLEKEKVM